MPKMTMVYGKDEKVNHSDAKWSRTRILLVR